MEKINQIKFSHIYKKFPTNWNSGITYIKDIALVDYKDLTPEQIEEDTAIVGGGNYPLPQTRLIWILLWTTGMKPSSAWGTMRRYTPQKFDYYSKLVGHEVKIVVDSL